MTWILFHGDVLDKLSEIETGTVQTCVTSPPYWRLRDYGVPGQLGLEPTPEEYVNKMVEVFREVRRVLRDDGTLWLNLGDSYNGSSGSGGKTAKQVTNAGSFHDAGVRIAPGLKPKDLVGIPWRVAFALQADGWYLRSDIIWAKPNPAPEYVTDRPSKSHEYIFLFAKSGDPQYWTHRDYPSVRKKPEPDIRWINQVTGEEVKEAPSDPKETVPCPECGGTGRITVDAFYDFFGEKIRNPIKEECSRCFGKKKIALWKRVNLWRGHDYFYDYEAIKEDAKPESEKRYKSTFYTGKKEISGQGRPGNASNTPGYKKWTGKRNKRSVWTVTTKPFKGAHFAVFPPDLIKPCILAGTSPQACEICGAPWERITERRAFHKKGWGEAKKDYMEGVSGLQSMIREGHGRAGEVKVRTLGWKPTCECEGNTGAGRCVVLDPFAGTGTTLYESELLGRDSIGIEISEKYCELIHERMGRFRMSLF